MNNTAKVNFWHLILSFIGFFIGLYLTWEHIQGKVNPGPLSCDIKDTIFNCSNVLMGTHGSIIGIPLGALGMAFFTIVIACTIWPKFSKISNKHVSKWQLIVAIIGALFAVALSIDMYFILKSVCLGCTTSHIITIINLGVAIFYYAKYKNEEDSAEAESFLKFVSLGLALTVPPILAGFILGNFADKMDFLKKNTPTAEVSSAAPKPTIPPTSAELPFSKSNYVGKGEDYRMGNDNAKLVVQMFADFECPGCKQASKAIKLAVKSVGLDRILLVYRNYPLSNKCNRYMQSEMHTTACDLALASRCAGQQGKYWEFNEWAYGLQDIQSIPERQEKISVANLKKVAAEMGIDANKFAECFESKIELAKIQDDVDTANKLGVKSTPYIFLNGSHIQFNYADPEETSKYFTDFLNSK